jgi:uncharacterized protein (TIGR00725 family)
MTDQRRHMAAVIGAARCGDAEMQLAEQLGEALVGGGFRLITGGLGGVMLGASRGARRAPGHRPGDVIGILPTYSSSHANEFVEVAICTGMNHARNVIVVASADVVFAVGGKSGTLSEIALAWKLEKPIITVGDVQGWAAQIAGMAIDDRREDRVHGPLSPQEAVRLAQQLMSPLRTPAKEF